MGEKKNLFNGNNQLIKITLVGFFIVLVIFLIFFLSKGSNFVYEQNLKDKSSFCEPESYQQCLALQEKKDSLCDELGATSEKCKIGYFLTFAEYEQKTTYCEKLSGELKYICEFLVTQDYEKCPENFKENCKKMLEFDFDKSGTEEEMNKSEKELWDTQLIAIALKNKDKNLCDRILNAKGNHMDSLRCELLLSKTEKDFCEKRLKSYCNAK